MSKRRPYLVCYDIADDKRLRQVARACSGYGQRLQYSVFLCPLDQAMLANLKATLLQLINNRHDQVVFAQLLGGDRKGTIDVIGRPAPQRERVTIV